MKTLIIDNYDSFTFNLCQYIAESSGNPEVRSNDGVSPHDIENGSYSHIVISPGPGTPEKSADFGVCNEVILKFGHRIPILGVCLGHEGIARAYGGSIVPAPKIMHGKRSIIEHTESPLFEGIPVKFEAMRYHSLCVSPDNFPSTLKITAVTEDDKTIMALEHGKFPVYGIQFHPESFGTPFGKKIIANFLKINP